MRFRLCPTRRRSDDADEFPVLTEKKLGRFDVTYIPMLDLIKGHVMYDTADGSKKTTRIGATVNAHFLGMDATFNMATRATDRLVVTKGDWRKAISQ